MAKKSISNLSYIGVRASSPPNFVVYDRAPLARDYKSFIIGDIWLQKNTVNVWMLTDKQSGVGTWTDISSTGDETFTSVTITTGDLTLQDGDIHVTNGDVYIHGGGLVFGLINFTSTLRTLADGTVYGLADTGAPAAGEGTVYHSNNSGIPQWGDIKSTGGTVTITTSATGINLEAAGGTAVGTFTADDANAAAPDGAGNIIIEGGTNITTEVTVAHTVTFNLDNDVTISGDFISTGGDIIASAGDIEATLGTITAGNGLVVTAGGLNITGGITIAGLNNGVVLSDNTGLLSSSDGINNYVLTSNGAGFVPTWQAVAADTGTKTFHTDAADATEAAQAITISGTANEIETSGAGSTVTIGIPNSPSFGGSATIATGLTVSNFTEGVVLSSGGGVFSSSPGTVDYVLTSNGPAANPTWKAVNDYAFDINAQVGIAYTLIIGDRGKEIQMTNAAAITLTIPTNAAVNFPVGTQIILVQYGAGTVTVVPAGGVTLNSASGMTDLYEQYSSAALIKQDNVNEWLLVGDLK